ncbi:hypothetical protein LCGC14_0900370 [marine sediment metagenome]|uniref:Uncharacterized protein n=1 Tax=marine sediment metagenome TaxID=412755 RepID=A0A0F9NWM0_9ZZZZ
MIVQRHDAPRGFTAADNIFTGENTFSGITTFTGNVGIGTASPQKNLHIQSTVPTIRLSDSNAATDQAVATLVELYRGNLTNRVGFWGMASSSNDIMQLATDYAAGEIVFSTGANSEAVRIDSAGDVGIGIAVPTSKLDVAGALTLSSTQPVFDFNETDGPVDEKFWRWTTSIGDLYLQTKTDALGVGANVLRITRTGTVVDLIRAVATSVDVVGALTATSYGGITGANLVARNVAESIAGAWVFTTAPEVSMLNTTLKFRNTATSAQDIQYLTDSTLTALVRYIPSSQVFQWQDRDPSTVTRMTLNLNTGDLTLTGQIQGNSLRVVGNVGFYNTAPIAKQTGVAVTAAGVHAALVNLGLIT